MEAVLAEGLNPRDLGLRKGFFGAEPGMSEPSVRARMEETWGMRAMDANFGMADILSIMGSECEQRQGLHFHAQGAVAVELIEPETGSSLCTHRGSRRRAGVYAPYQGSTTTDTLSRPRCRTYPGNRAVRLWTDKLSLPYPGSQ